MFRARADRGRRGVRRAAASRRAQPAAAAKKPAAFSAEEIDRLLAPIALYPDQLLAQMLLCAQNARKVGELSAWLKKNTTLKGTELQEAAEKAGFEPSFVALALFPQVVEHDGRQLDWTTQLGQAFAADRRRCSTASSGCGRRPRRRAT